jgi:hypothetical protein
MLKNYSAIFGQSIFDVCLNTYGSLDRLVKLLQDSGAGQGVNDTPASGQVYVYDDALVVDQQVNQSFLLSGLRYATLLGKNGSTYYVIKQKQPRTLPRPNDPEIPDETGLPGPPNDDMAKVTEAANYTSNADGTTLIIPLNKDGNSMSGGLYDIVQVEIEIKPLKVGDWQWNKNTGQLILLNGVVLDNTQTIFYIYEKQL